MATAVYKVNYQGLRKRESYNEIVDYLENKQEKINYPNRFAKQIRNSPQLSNLLDGEGMGAVEMEEQQMKAMEHEQAEQAVRQAGGTAQVLRAAASQTDKPELRGQTNVGGGGYQAERPVLRKQTNVGGGGYQPTTPQIIDMTVDDIADTEMDDNISSVADDIQEVRDQRAQQVEQKRGNITSILQSHLGTEVTPGNLDFAHQLAQQVGGGSSSSSAPLPIPPPPKAPAPNEALLNKPPSPRLRDPIDKRTKPQNGNPKTKAKGGPIGLGETGGGSSSSSAPPMAKSKSASLPPPPKAEQLGASSKAKPPTPPKAEQLGASSKAKPPTPPKAEQLGASSKAKPRAKPEKEQLSQIGAGDTGGPDGPKRRGRPKGSKNKPKY